MEILLKMYLKKTFKIYILKGIFQIFIFLKMRVYDYDVFLKNGTNFKTL